MPDDALGIRGKGSRIDDSGSSGYAPPPETQQKPTLRVPQDCMRIALVSPYSWSYPGGVTRHIEALAEQYLAAGHDVRVLAPYDPPT